MELSNYIVKEGDTLSRIAAQHKTDIATMKQLNPFIRNTDHIQTGWSLSVPKDESQQASSEEAQPAATSTGQTDATNCVSVLKLGPPPSPQCSSTECFAPADQPPCSQQYGNILYATDEQEFWLLPERAASAIKEAEHLLSQQIAPSKSPDDRKRGLDESGLLDYFLEPELANFLEGEQRERMLQIQAQEPYLQQRYLNKRGHMLSDPRYGATSLRVEYERLEALYQEWKPLHDRALAQAQAEDYTYEDGVLFSPEATEARKAVQRYIKAREKLLKQKDGKLPGSYPQELATFVAESAARYNEAIDCRTNCLAPFTSYISWRNSNEQKFGEQREYLESIVEAAQYGLALPEFALVGGNYNVDPSKTDLSAGVQRLQEYLDLEKQQLEVHARLREKYRTWLEASGENTPAPASLVDAERNEWERIQADKDKLRLQAEQNVAGMHPRRHLLWHPEEFQPKPVQRLVKTNFPLREVSVSDGKSLLSHFSLNNINQALREDAAKIAKDSAKNLRKKLPQKSGAAAASASSAFRNWLLEQGAFMIDDQDGDWFDAQGWFDVERFHEYLQYNKIEVATLADAGARQAWGERLRQLLFKRDVRIALRLFDTSPQAQLVRCLTPPQESIHKGASIIAPTLSMANGFSAGVNATLDIDLARGEVELLKVDLPERANAQDFVAEYFDYEQQPQTMSLGRFSMHINVRAWGYAGASLMLAGTLRLGPDKASHDVVLGPPQPAQRTPGILQHTAVSESRLTGRGANARVDDGLSAQFTLFAGIQAGIKLDGALNWAPPAALAVLRSIQVVNDADAQATEQSEQWLPLARLSANLSAAVGLGAKGDLTISLIEGRFVLRIKAALIAGPGVDGMFSFEIGYESVGQLINLFRRELRKNQYRQLDWVDGSAFDLMTKMNLLGALGIDVSMLYLTGIDAIFSLYEALTSGGKGGVIAHTIMTYRSPEELEQWFVEAIPEALGPMLMTLISSPSSFKVPEIVMDEDGELVEKKVTKPAAESHLYQQQAIERILGWIVARARQQGTLVAAQRQFEEACTRMNRFGTKPPTAGQAYCENRLALDNFMDVGVMRVGADGDRNDEMRSRYLVHAAALGAQADQFCRRSSYHGHIFVPGGRAEFIGTSE
jgi:murein DD-endopeptidase MepM/ murein hydrolase activator NlpD